MSAPRSVRCVYIPPSLEDLDRIGKTLYAKLGALEALILEQKNKKNGCESEVPNSFRCHGKCLASDEPLQKCPNAKTGARLCRQHFQFCEKIGDLYHLFVDEYNNDITRYYIRRVDDLLNFSDERYPGIENYTNFTAMFLPVQLEDSPRYIQDWDTIFNTYGLLNLDRIISMHDSINTLLITYVLFNIETRLRYLGSVVCFMQIDNSHYFKLVLTGTLTDRLGELLGVSPSLNTPKDLTQPGSIYQQINVIRDLFHLYRHLVLNPYLLPMLINFRPNNRIELNPLYRLNPNNMLFPDNILVGVFQKLFDNPRNIEGSNLTFLTDEAARWTKDEAYMISEIEHQITRYSQGPGWFQEFDSALNSRKYESIYELLNLLAESYIPKSRLPVILFGLRRRTPQYKSASDDLPETASFPLPISEYLLTEHD